MRRSPVLAAGVAGCLAAAAVPLFSQPALRSRPLAVLESAPVLEFPSATDSNSPALWVMVRGMLRLVVFNSAPGPVLSIGPDLDELRTLLPAMFGSEVNGARWIEAVVPDRAGRLYGFYHNEPAGACPGDPTKTVPRIGAARSQNGGLSWTDLGIILEAARAPFDCESPNRYFAGGVGDFSVILDRSETDLYILFSAYGPAVEAQGVALARMRWADRDVPAGNVAIWSQEAWRYPEADGQGWAYPAPTPFLRSAVSWHSRTRAPDAFWGPSVHWNTFLDRYVMLLNRATDKEWSQEGIYLSSTPTIENPHSWSLPQKIFDGGRWYPQVIGLERGVGTDKVAGERARFFMSGRSEHEIVFQPRGDAAMRRP